MTEDNAYAEISMLVHKYADAVVHRNGTQWSSTWHQDAVWDLGGGRLVEGLDAIKDLCLLYTSPSPRDRQKSRMPSSA